MTGSLGAGAHLIDDGFPSLALLGAQATIRIATYLLLAAIIISFRRSFDRERYLALRDRMTGALNKEAFHQHAATMVETAARAGQMLVLAIVDLDDFKTANDRAGHAGGDAVLRAFARRVASTIRREDAFGRIGGDEFAFLLPVPSAEEGRRLVATLHSRLSAALAETMPPITCSMGALLVPPDALRNAGELIHAADFAMYRVKQAGKNAVHIGMAAGRSTAAIPSSPLR